MDAVIERNFGNFLWTSYKQEYTLKIIGFVWYNEIVRKIVQKHNVQQNEVREVFANHPRFRFVEKGHKHDENVYAAFGRSKSGRYLIIFFIYEQFDRNTS